MFKTIEGFSDVIAAHWAERPNYGGGELAQDFAKSLEAMNAELVAYVLHRQDDNAIVGYAVFADLLNPYKEDSVLASNVALYIDPSLRGAGYGKAFIEAIEADMYNEGYDGVVLQFKPYAVPTTLLSSLGYEPSEVQYMKLLEQFQ